MAEHIVRTCSACGHWRMLADEVAPGNCPACGNTPLFAGEPERCSLCGEKGHTHDDHWLFDHEPVKALQARLLEAESVAREAAKAAVTDAQYERLRFIREAAIRIYAKYGEKDADDAWRMARALWDAKPEDC